MLEDAFASGTPAETLGRMGPGQARVVELRDLKSDTPYVVGVKPIGTCVEGAIVLFSPACASFDQFRDFEQRGLAFRQEAAKLVKRRTPTEPA